MRTRYFSATEILDLLGEICCECQSRIRERLAKEINLTVEQQRKQRLERLERLKHILVAVSRKNYADIQEVVGKSNSVICKKTRLEFAEAAKKAGYSHEEIGQITHRHRGSISYILHPEYKTHRRRNLTAKRKSKKILALRAL